MGFEIVVRPVVFPNIRPAPARSLPPQDDPDKGFAVIRGNGARQVSLSNSWNASSSSSKKQETKRRVDEVRVYQKEEDGTVNKANFVDVQVANKIWMEGGKKPTTPAPTKAEWEAAQQQKETFAKEREIWWFQRAKEADNRLIMKRDKIIEADQK